MSNSPDRSKVVTVFGSSRDKPNDPRYKTAYELGYALARAGYTVCNGGYGGTMEATAKGAKDAGGSTIGVTCGIFSRSGPNAYIDEEIDTPDLYERLRTLVELGNAYIALPGGSGTLVELSLVWEMVAKRLIKPRPVLLYSDYWKPAIDTAALERPATANLVHVVNTANEALMKIKGDILLF